MATQLTPTTELQAINTMLSSIGEAPVNSISGTNNVDVAVAINILNETSLAVQSEGWNFNTEYNVSYSLDTDNKLPLPSNCVQADAGSANRDRNLVIRNGFIYDLDNHTDVLTASVPLDVVLVQLFEQLPEYARRYITAKSARRFAARFIGDAGLTELAEVDEQEAYNNFKLSDSRSEDNNILEGDANTYSIINRPPRRTY